MLRNLERQYRQDNSSIPGSRQILFGMCKSARRRILHIRNVSLAQKVVHATKTIRSSHISRLMEFLISLDMALGRWTDVGVMGKYGRCDPTPTALVGPPCMTYTRTGSTLPRRQVLVVISHYDFVRSGVGFPDQAPPSHPTKTSTTVPEPYRTVAADLH